MSQSVSHGRLLGEVCGDGGASGLRIRGRPSSHLRPAPPGASPTHRLSAATRRTTLPPALPPVSTHRLPNTTPRPAFPLHHLKRPLLLPHPHIPIARLSLSRPLVLLSCGQPAACHNVPVPLFHSTTHGSFIQAAVIGIHPPDQLGINAPPTI